MTNDYKEKLIKYLTGNIDNETGDNEPQFMDGGYTGENITAYLNSQFQYGIVFTRKVTSINSSYYLFYGNYYNDSQEHTMNGYILITTMNVEPVQLITEYSSGTLMRPFNNLAMDEEGYIYGVDEDYNYNATKIYDNFRFIMLNKVLSSELNTGTFEVKLRKSYYVPNDILSSVFNVGICKKRANTSDYFMLIQTPNSNPGILSLTINVGASNDWKLTTTQLIEYWASSDMFFEYGDDFKIIISAPITLQPSGTPVLYNYREVVYTFSENPSFSIFKTFAAPNLPQAGLTLSKMAKMGLTNTYLQYTETQNGVSTAYIYKLNYNNSTMELFYELAKPDYFIGTQVDFKIIETELFFRISWYTADSNDREVEGYIGMIIDKSVYTTELETIEYDYDTSGFLVDKTYNLYNIYYNVNDNKAKKIQLIYNLTNYNGLSYENTECLMPNSAVLYDDNSNLIFARNLYNKTVLGATTTSTVQIPNTMLNDVTIGKNSLISKTNLTLVEDTTEIEKNIYETLNINFQNSLSIKNNNNPSNPIFNPVASARLNGSTSQNNNYDDVKATKVRVNYTDDTNMVITLNADTQIISLTSTSYQYNFILHIIKEVDNLEIISNDELTSYQTIDNLNLEVGKTYNILQNVEVQ